MKALKNFCVVFGVFTILFSGNVFAQAEVITNYEIEIHLTKKIRDEDGKVIGTEIVHTLNSGIEQMVITPIGNYLRKVKFKIEDENSIMELANPVAYLRITMRADIDGDGEEEVIKSNRAVLTSSGNLSLIYHLNGVDK